MNKSIRYGAVVALLMIAALLVNFTVVQGLREDAVSYTHLTLPTKA